MKKKHFAAFLLVLLLALGTSVQALAEEPAEEGAFRNEAPEEGVFQNGSFSGPQTIPGEPKTVAEYSWEESLKQMLLNAWRNRQSQVDISSLKIPHGQINQYWVVAQSVLNDNPNMFYAKLGSVWNNGSILIRQDLQYIAMDDLDQAIKDFDTAANRALSQVKGLTEPVEIALVLHDWLVVNCLYNWEVAKNTNLSIGQYGDAYVDSGMPWSAYGALVKGDAVCQGYALAYKYLLNQAGVPSVVISSSAMNHAWNAVQLGGQWYQVDATWDDPVHNREGRARHAYFLLSDSTFGTDDNSKGRSRHYGWEQIVTCSSTAYESGYVFVDNDHPLYHWKNSFYYVKSEPASNVNGGTYTYNCNSVYMTTSLNNAGNRLASGLGLSSGAAILWTDGRVYLMPGGFSGSNEKVLLVYDLGNGVTAQAGHFTHTPAASPDGYASASSDNYPGLRYNDQTNEVEVVSCTRRQTVYSVPAVSLPNSWSGLQAGGEYQAGVAPGVSDDAAAVLWGNYPGEGLTLWAAFYDNSGKLLKYQAVGSSEIARADISNIRPNMVLAYLDPPSSYASVRLMLLDTNKLPACAAG